VPDIVPAIVPVVNVGPPPRQLDNIEMCLVENYSNSKDPKWLLALLTDKIEYLETNLKATLENGIDVESSVIKRLEVYKDLSENLRL
jgi:hypothetical protein